MQVSCVNAPSTLTFRVPSAGAVQTSCILLPWSESRLPTEGWKHASIAQSTASHGSIGDFPWRRSFLLFHSDHIPHKIISRSSGLQLALSSKSLVQVLGFSLGNLMPVSCFSFSQNLWSVVYSVNPSNNSHTKQDVPGMKNKANWILLGCGAWQGAPLLCSCTVTGVLGGCVEDKIYFSLLILHDFWHTIYSQCVFTRVAINFVSILERILLELVTSLF
jgi:hypothetical protein